MNLFEAKRQHGLLYVTELPEGNVVWKPLKWGRYKTYRELAIQFPGLVPDLEDQIWDECVLEAPPELGSTDMQNAGIITTVCRQIIDASGITDPRVSMFQLDMWRQAVNQVDEQMTVLVCKAFNYTPEDLDQLPYEQLLRRVAMAEIMVGTQVMLAGAMEEAPVEQGLDIEREAQDLERFDTQGAAPQRPQTDLRAMYLQQRGLTGPDG